MKRIELMESSGLPCETDAPRVDERSIEASLRGPKPRDLVLRLAEAKARDVQSRHPNQVVVGADTVVSTARGEILHKPTGLTDALRMAMKQSGTAVTIRTGAVVVHGSQIRKHVSTSRLRYVAFDEATARAAFERTGVVLCNGALGFSHDSPGFALVATFHGSYSGAMGLPMDFIGKALTDLGSRRQGLAANALPIAARSRLAPWRPPMSAPRI